MEATDLEASHPPLNWSLHFPLNVIPTKKNLSVEEKWQFEKYFLYLASTA